MQEPPEAYMKLKLTHCAWLSSITNKTKLRLDKEVEGGDLFGLCTIISQHEARNRQGTGSRTRRDATRRDATRHGAHT